MCNVIRTKVTEVVVCCNQKAGKNIGVWVALGRAERLGKLEVLVTGANMVNMLAIDVKAGRMGRIESLTHIVHWGPGLSTPVFLCQLLNSPFT